MIPIAPLKNFFLPISLIWFWVFNKGDKNREMVETKRGGEVIFEEEEMIKTKCFFFLGRI